MIRWVVMLFVNCLLAVTTIWCGIFLIDGNIGASASDMGGLALIAYGLSIALPMIFDAVGE